MVPLSFAQQEFALLRANALFWPRENALLVADLHLEKGSFFARHGQMIPPYDTCETLHRVAQALRDTGARRVYTLGDNFHDSDGVNRLDPYARGILDILTRMADWVWITGNHDPDISAPAGATLCDEVEIDGIILRHAPQQAETRPEITGHFHPRLNVTVRNRTIRRPCAVVSSRDSGGGRMILPAFGAYTGGMDAGDPAIIAALQPACAINALVCAGEKIATFPLWRASVTLPA